MKKLIFKAVSAATILLSAMPAHASWKRAESKHFIVYGDMSASDLRNRTEKLEQFDSMMRMLFKVEDSVPGTIFILPTLGEIQSLAKNRNVAGFYSASSQLAYGFVPERMPDYYSLDERSILMHEYAHHMLLGATNVAMPGWASEGLAEFFMSARLNDDGSVKIGESNPSRSREMLRGKVWSVEDLITSDSRKYSGEESIQKYTRGWALIHYLWLSGKRPGQFVDFVTRLNDTGDALASAKAAFGDLGKLDKEIDAYLKRSTFPAAEFSAEQLNTPSDVKVRDLTEGEEAILRYRMTSLLGVDATTAPQLEAKAAPVGAQYPNDPFVQRAMAEIEYDAKHYEDARLAAERTLAVDPDNVMAMAYLGRVAAQRALQTQDAADWKLARDWFLKANKADPNHPLPFQLYYDSFAAAGQRPSKDAINGLLRAVVLMPQDTGLRVQAGLELIRAGDMKVGRRIIAPVAFNPHADQDNPYRKLVEHMDAGDDHDALLDYIAKEKLSERINEFLAPAIAEAEKDKDKDGKDKDKNSDSIAVD